MRLLLALLLIGGVAEKACEKAKEAITTPDVEPSLPPDPKPSPTVEPSLPPVTEPSPTACAPSTPCPCSPEHFKCIAACEGRSSWWECAPLPAPSPVPSPSPLPDCRSLGCPAGWQCERVRADDSYSCFIASPSPSPCVPSSPVPTCEKPAGCVSCAAYMADAIRSGELIREGRLVYNIGNAGKEYFDPETCNTVWPDGSLRNRRLHKDGTICPTCQPAPSPAPCTPATPQPGTPNPGPTPASCPALVRWGGGLHAQMTPQFQGLPKEPTFAGNTIDLDSTARFGGREGERGRPCNDEHHAVCEANGIDDGPNWRRCEDPRGPIFTVLSGGFRKQKLINGGWGLRLEGIEAGTIRVRICPRPDVQDALGVPVRVLGDACTVAEIPVQ